MSHSNVKVQVVLSDTERAEVETLVKSGTLSARRVRQARILLMADEDRRDGRNPDWYIAQCVGISERQVARARQRFDHEGLAGTLGRKTRSDANIPKKMEGAVEARLVTLCCSEPPVGFQRWTIQLLADELCRLQVVTSICPESVRRCLKKIASSPGVQNVSVSRSRTAPVSWPRWSKSSTRTTRNTMKGTP